MNEPARLYSPEAEQSVIGSLLIQPDVADQCGALRPDHFFAEGHRLVFAEIQAMIAAGQPVDVVTVAEQLDLKGLSEQTGGLAYLGDVVGNTPTAANAGRYAQTVIGKAMERQLLAAADTIRGTVEGAGTTAEKLAAAQAAVMGISEASAVRHPRAMRDVLASVVATLEARSTGQVKALPTGFADLDDKLSGGLRGGNLVIVAGRPSMGKTSLATNIGLAAAESGQTAGLLSMEMSDQELTDRMIAQVGSVSLHDVVTGNLSGDAGERMLYAVDRLRDLPVVIDDQGGLTLFDVVSKARSIRRRHGLGLLVVDYLQLMSGDGDNRNAQLEPITRGLKALAKELDIPVIVLSQLSRKCEDRPNRRPVMSDLRDSGAIEQDADVILFVYRDEVYHPDSPDKGTAEIVIGKNRQGSTGVVRLAYRGACTQFADLSLDWQPAFREGATKKRRGFDG